MLTLAFAQDASAQGSMQPGGNPIMGFLPIIVIFVIFYFLLIRPQKKQQKEHKQMLSELKKNDEVVTAGGVFGTVVNIQNDVVSLRVDDNTRIKVQKASISGLRKKQG